MKDSTIYQIDFKNNEDEWEVYRVCDTWESAESQSRWLGGDVKITRIETTIEETVLMERILEGAKQ